MTARLPLNGKRTHPLSAHALAALTDLATHGPQPSATINPGVINRLWREDLIELVDLPSPYASHRGRPLQHARITTAGKAALK